MRRFCSILSFLLACLIVASTVRGQDPDNPPPKKKKRSMTAAQRFDAMEKAANHDPLKGELTKDEFIAAVKSVQPKQADKAEDMFKGITKADEGKVTKDEYVAWTKAEAAKRKKKKKDDADAAKKDDSTKKDDPAKKDDSK
jgi:hypothetical protein